MEVRLKMGAVVYIIASLLLAGVLIGTFLAKDGKSYTTLVSSGILILWSLVVIVRSRYKINKKAVKGSFKLG